MAHESHLQREGGKASAGPRASVRNVQVVASSCKAILAQVSNWCEQQTQISPVMQQY